jgi:hypothetical protein
MYTDLHVKFPSYLSDFNDNLNFLDRFSENTQNTGFHKNPFGGSRVAPCERTDMRNIFAILRTRLKTARHETFLHHRSVLSLLWNPGVHHSFKKPPPASQSLLHTFQYVTSLYTLFHVRCTPQHPHVYVADHYCDHNDLLFQTSYPKISERNPADSPSCGRNVPRYLKFLTPEFYISFK